MFSTVPRRVRELKISSGDVALLREPVRILSFDRSKSAPPNATELWSGVSLHEHGAPQGPEPAERPDIRSTIPPRRRGAEAHVAGEDFARRVTWNQADAEPIPG